MEDQNVVIENGKISVIQKGVDVAAAAGATVLDLHGCTLMPAIVGMHNHLFAHPNLNSQRTFDPPLLLPQMTFSSPFLSHARSVG